MVLLSAMMRQAALTRDSEPIRSWFAGRQLGPWIEQRPRAQGPAVRPAPAPRPRDPAEALATLQDLHRRGVLDDEELRALRARLGV